MVRSWRDERPAQQDGQVSWNHCFAGRLAVADRNIPEKSKDRRGKSTKRKTSIEGAIVNQFRHRVQVVRGRIGKMWRSFCLNSLQRCFIKRTKREKWNLMTITPISNILHYLIKAVAGAQLTLLHLRFILPIENHVVFASLVLGDGNVERWKEQSRVSPRRRRDHGADNV